VRLGIALLIVFAAVLIWSIINPHDYFTWILEVFPAIIGLVLILATYRRFPLTPLLLTLLCLHAVILMIGGHYTYAEVPFGFWMQDTFGFSRNHYDRIGHFAQGFVPAILAREIFIRKEVVRDRRWLYVFIVSVCLAFSALYELLEWAVSALSGSKGDSFLGTQGDIWDTQKDMFLALLGAMTAPLLLGRLHDRQLRRVSSG
jgi:putative membrane protein